MKAKGRNHDTEVRLLRSRDYTRKQHRDTKQKQVHRGQRMNSNIQLTNNQQRVHNAPKKKHTTRQRTKNGTSTPNKIWNTAEGVNTISRLRASQYNKKIHPKYQ